MTPERLRELVSRMIDVGYQPAPKDPEGAADDDYRSRAVRTSTPDGVYFRFDGKDSSDDIQVLIVGPMSMTPGEYAAKIGLGYKVDFCSFLATDLLKNHMKQLVKDRGFISLLLTPA